jgi:hypothetical protein
MYAVDSGDRVISLTNVPKSNSGAPIPVVVADEGNLVLAYLVNEPDPNWDGTYANVVDPSSQGACSLASGTTSSHFTTRYSNASPKASPLLRIGAAGTLSIH